jgi:hypothetical protein
MLPSFFMWVLIGGIKEAVLIYIGWGSKSYPHVWAWASALMIGLALALVIEAHAVCARFSGQPGRAPVVALLICGALASGLASTWILSDGLPTHPGFVNHVFVADQLASFSFAAFLILSATFYGWVAVPLPRAIKVHRMNVGAYFVATGLAYYLIHFTHGKALISASAFLMLGSLVLMLRWAEIGPMDEIELPDATEEQKRYVRREIRRRVRKPWFVSESPVPERTTVSSSVEQLVQPFL